MRRVAVILVAAMSLASGDPSAQAPAAAPRTPSADRFEVSSVALNTSGEPKGGIPGPAGNAFMGINVSFEELVRWAYGIGQRYPRDWVSPNRWAGLDLGSVPRPLLETRFEVRGKAPTQVPEPRSGSLGGFHSMVQALLAERFGLVTRWEQRERTRYAMTLEAPQGIDLRLAGVAEGCLLPSAVVAATTLPRATCMLPSRGNGFSGTRMTMGGLAESLGNRFDAEVVDRTGQKALFHVVINFAANTEPAQERDALLGAFGIRLTPEPAPQQVLVVERAEMPSVTN